MRNNLTRTIFTVLLATLATFPHVRSQNREPSRPQTKSSRTVEQNAESDKVKKDDERLKQSRSIIEQVLGTSKSVLNPIVRMKIRLVAADAFWEFEPEQSRQILAAEFSQLQTIFQPGSETQFGEFWSSNNGKPTYKGMPSEQVKSQLRRDLLAAASAHDLALARELVAAERKNEKPAEGGPEHMDEVLATARSLADIDPEAAARIINDSLKHGLDEFLPFALANLRETAPAEASALFNRAFSSVKSRGDLWDYQRLVPYILPTELDRLVGGKHYLTDPQRMRDANMMVEYAAELLYRRIQSESPANMSPDLVRREFYLWRNLEAVISDLKPESMWLVNSRLRQLTASLPESVQRPAQGPWSEERLNSLLAAANTSSGEKRDEYLQSAAFATWRFGQGDLDKAIALAEKIGSTHLRDMSTGGLYFQAGMKFLSSEGPDYVLSLARKINLPGLRTRLFLATIRNLTSLKAIERTQVLREELLSWLRNCDKNSDTAWAVLDYLDAAPADDSERNFAAFEILVRVLNSPNLEPELKVKNRVYWHPEMHDFRKSLMQLAKADFERGIQLIQMLSNKEVSMQVQAAFCGDYLKVRNRSKKPSTPEKPKNQLP